MLTFEGTVAYDPQDESRWKRFGPFSSYYCNSFPERRWASDDLSGYSVERAWIFRIGRYGLRLYFHWLDVDGTRHWMNREFAWYNGT